MNRNILLIFGLVLLISVGSFLVIDRSELSENPEENDVSVPADWEQYQNMEFGFELQYPPSATIRQEAGTHIKFTYLGGPQATGEVTDGFTFTIGTNSLGANQTLNQFAEDSHEEMLRAGTSLQEPTQVDLYGMNAYFFRVETLGEVSVYVVAGSGDGRVHTISYNVADPNGQDYQAMIETMLETFQVLPVQNNGVSDTPDGSRDSEAAPPTVDTVSLAMLEVGDDGEGERFGCDHLAFVEREVAPTASPLSSAMQELFSIATTSVNGHYNFIANTNDTLTFQRATVVDGVASVYLTGELSGLVGVCDDPRARIQIEQTALQFEAVDEVQIYLNDERNNLQPNQREE